MIDSSETDRRLMRSAFEDAVSGCAFVGVTNWREALRYLNTGISPDLIVLTLDDDLSGLEFVRLLQAEPEWRSIPVSVFSAGSGHPEEKAAVYAWGVSDYRTKPIDFDALVAVASDLREFMDQRKESRKPTVAQ
jgi:CheY-like chemotaxis protein